MANLYFFEKCPLRGWTRKACIINGYKKELSLILIKKFKIRPVHFGAAGGILHGRMQQSTGLLLPKTLRRRLSFLEADFESLFFMR